MSHLRVSEFLHGLSDMTGNLGEGLVSVGPIGDRSPIGRDSLELAERGSIPIVYVPKDDRDEPSFPLVMPLQGPLQLDIPAIVGGDEVGTDQK
jgi:hypothetical protein